MKKYLLLLFLVPFSLFSQQIQLKVVDDETSEPIYAAQLKVVGGMNGLTDLEGIAILSVTQIPATVIILSPEYTSDTLVFNAVSGEQTIRLKSIVQAKEIGPVVVAASRHKQAVEDITVSLDIIKPSLIANKGITDLEQAVDQTPGAYTMDGQVSIRGGSGFSYGAGSRVLVLWNEVPLLSADAGDAKWNAIPIESASQIEVIKGASSVLYGSGALNGIVALTEREPGIKPYFTGKLQSGIYDNPKRSTLQWWEKGKNPMLHQADFTYGKQFKHFGLNLGLAGFTTDGYRKGETEDRARINGTIFLKQSRIKNLKVSLGWNAQYQKAGNFIIWQSDTFAYQPAGGTDTSLATSTLTYNRGLRISVDPSIKYFDKKGNKHQLKTRYYFVDNLNYSNSAQSSKSEVLYADYQFQKEWKGPKIILTTGTSVTNNRVNSYLYGNHQSLNNAVYLQADKKWKKIDITAGFRMEYFQQDGRSGDSDFYFGKDSTKLPVRPIFRTGIHYAVAKYTHLRASFGQGVRYPSVAERYASTSVGSLNIFPNPNVKPETGLAAEFGVKQGIKIGNWKGFLDGAVFINHYDNMMEFTLGVYNPDSIPLNYFNQNSPGYIKKWIGFSATNAESATITGMEYSLSGEGNIGPVTIQTLMGYTYMNPITKNRDSAYVATFSNDSTSLLKYRFRHLAKADIQLIYKGFSLGGSMRMNSFMVNIDKPFEDGVLGTQILPGLKRYRKEHNGPNIVFDFRVGYEWKDHYKVNFIVNNIANTEYMGRPGDIQAPRAFMCQLSYKL